MKFYCVTAINRHNTPRDEWFTTKRAAIKAQREWKHKLLVQAEQDGARIGGSVSLRLVRPKKMRRADMILCLLRGDTGWAEVEQLKTETVLASGQSKLFNPDGSSRTREREEVAACDVQD